MSRSRVLRNAALVVLVVLLGGGSFFWGDKHALETRVITRATPDQLANAMQQDSFYSNYRGSTLLVDATIASVTHRAGATIVKLVTTSSLTVLCNLDLINLFNPERIVIGGWVDEILEAKLLPAIREVASRQALRMPFSAVSIVPAQLGRDAVTLGAATLPVNDFLASGAVPSMRKTTRATLRPALAVRHRV